MSRGYGGNNVVGALLIFDGGRSRFDNRCAALLIFDSYSDDIGAFLRVYRDGALLILDGGYRDSFGNCIRAILDGYRDGAIRTLLFVERVEVRFGEFFIKVRVMAHVVRRRRCRRRW